jgi:hypothetical protein
MNLDSNIIQKTIQSLLTDVTPKVLMTSSIPDISELSTISTSASAYEQQEQDDSEENDKEKKPHKKRKSHHHAISVLYEKMNAANVEMNTQKNAGCFKYQETVVDVQSQVPRPNSLSETYLTREMTDYIKTESKKILTFECTINNQPSV